MLFQRYIEVTIPRHAVICMGSIFGLLFLSVTDKIRFSPNKHAYTLVMLVHYMKVKYLISARR